MEGDFERLLLQGLTRRDSDCLSRRLCDAVAPEVRAGAAALAAAWSQLLGAELQVRHVGTSVRVERREESSAVVFGWGAGPCLRIDVELAHGLVDAQLGGGARPQELGAAAPRRPSSWSPLERRLLTRAAEQLADALRTVWPWLEWPAGAAWGDSDTWRELVARGEQLTRAEPGAAGPTTSGTGPLVVAFEATSPAAGVSGGCQLLLPEAFAAPAQARDEGLEVIAVLGELELPEGAVEELAAGDIIVTDTAADSPVALWIDGHPCLTGRAGIHQTRKAVRIEHVG